MRYLMLIIMIFAFVACGRIESGAEQRAEQSEVVATSEPSKEVLASLESGVVLKPGAAIIFTSNYAGSLEVGEIAPLILQIQPQYAAGQLEVSLSVPTGLSVVGQTQYLESFVEPQEFSYEVMISADMPGEYYLGIIVSVVTDSGLEEARAFAEVIRVTDSEAVLALKQVSVEEGAEAVSDSGEQVEHFMQAEEEIMSGP